MLQLSFRTCPTAAKAARWVASHCGLLRRAGDVEISRLLRRSEERSMTGEWRCGSSNLLQVKVKYAKLEIFDLGAQPPVNYETPVNAAYGSTKCSHSEFKTLASLLLMQNTDS